MTKILEKIMDIPSIGLEVKVMIIYTPKSKSSLGDWYGSGTVIDGDFEKLEEGDCYKTNLGSIAISKKNISNGKNRIEFVGMSELLFKEFLRINGFHGTIYSFFMSSFSISSSIVSSRENLALKLILFPPLSATIAIMPTIVTHVRQKSRTVNVWLSTVSPPQILDKKSNQIFICTKLNFLHANLNPR